LVVRAWVRSRIWGKRENPRIWRKSEHPRIWRKREHPRIWRKKEHPSTANFKDFFTNKEWARAG
jgi:hypothetical protein